MAPLTMLTARRETPAHILRRGAHMMKLSTAVHDFVLHLRMEGKAKATIVAYESDLHLLTSLATVHGGDSVLAFTTELVRDYFLALSRRDLSPATLHRRSASVSQFAKWGLRRRLWAFDPMADAPKIRKPKHLPRPYTHEEHDRIMALDLSGTERTLRALLYYAGLRISEALGLRLKDAILGDDDQPGYLRIRGKGNKDRTVPMFPELRAVLYDDFLGRPEARIQEFVFQRNGGVPWTRRMAERRTSAWGTAARVVDCEPHRFRHTCGTHLHEKGWALRDIADFLGHADMNTTMLYTKVTPRRLMESVQRMPLTGRGSVTPPRSAG